MVYWRYILLFFHTFLLIKIKASFLTFKSESESLFELERNKKMKTRSFNNDFINLLGEEHKDLINIYKIINDTVTNDPNFKGASYNKTAYISDTVGPRLWGSPALELALKMMKDIMVQDGFENVKLEQIDNVPVWKRGAEYLLLRDPRIEPVKIPMIGLGLSVGGNLSNVEVVVVNDFDELDKAVVTNKIVMLNGKWDKGYFNTVKYRSQGASRAAKKGAVGIIIRSIAPKSLETPHTGRVDYAEGVNKIPACAISLEDSDMLERMAKRNQKIVVDLYMEASFDAQNSTTYNLVGEYAGSEKSDEIVLMGGHLDSWDTGPQTGANDDLSGFYVCYEAVRVLIKNNLRPKRTIRVVGWSGEEMGFPNKGAFEYARIHKNELSKHVVAFESDEGVTQLKGFGFNGSPKAYSIVNIICYIMQYSNDYHKVYYNNGTAVDTTPLYNAGIPQMINILDDPLSQTYNDQYFYYHHSAADTISVLTQSAMDSNVIGIASMFYTIADLPEMLPKNDSN